MKRSKCGMTLVRIGLATGALAASGTAQASLTRNAAGAKNIGEAGMLTVDTAVEFERDSDGSVQLLQADIQYQASSRIQLLVESTLFESQRRHGAGSPSGVGDTDLTASWLAARVRGARPSIVLGAKVRVPTATRNEIGSGKPDYSALMILGKEFGELELSLETELTTYGQAGRDKLKEQLLYTVTGEYGLNDFLSIYGELFGNSAPTAVESRTDAARIGLEVDIPAGERLAPYLSFEVDTEGASAARAGVEWNW